MRSLEQRNGDSSGAGAAPSRLALPRNWIPLGVALTVVIASLFGVVAVVKAAGATDDDYRYLVSLKNKTFIPTAGDYAAGLAYMAGHQAEGSVHVLVQMNDVPVAATRLSLADHGLVLQGYLPERTFYALMSTKLGASDLQAMGVRWIAPLQREDKISPRVQQNEYAPWTDFDHGWKIYAVQFHSDVTQSQAEELMAAVPRTEGGWIHSTTTMIVAMDPSQVESLWQADGIKYIDVRPPVLTQVNDGIRQALSVNQLQGAPYNLTGGGSSVLVYDAGLADRNHPDFATSRVTWGEGGGIADHSTHVSGTVAGNGANSGGQYKGMAPSALITSYEYESCSPYCLYNSPQDIEANYSDGHFNHNDMLATNSIGSNIAPNGYNCSWEGDYEHTAQLIDAISNGSLGDPFLSVWAAGNERGYSRCGTTYNTTGVPATAKDIIVVGATNSNDHSMTYFSSWGPVDDGRIRPDVCAPGCQNGGDGGITSTVPGGGYGVMCGTSMATPATSGCIAAILQQWRITFGIGIHAKPLPAEIKALLIETAQDYGNAGPDFQFGYGEIRPVAAVDVIRNHDLIKATTIGQGAEQIYNIEVPQGLSSLKATLAWDDPQGEYLAQKELVNDLDLTLESPSHAITSPWVLNPSSPSSPATRGADHLNPVEQVQVDNPVAGIWKLHVKGYQVPQGPQSYGLIANVVLTNPTDAVPESRPAGASIADLSSNPNPFSPRTTIRFRIDGSAPVSLFVFDASGRKVRTLLSGERRPAGTQFVSWDGKDDLGRELASGVYLYQVSAGTKNAEQKVLMVK